MSIRKVLFAATALAISSAPALASTASNTTISNTASVSYNDAGGNAQTPVTASATVTVSLVPSALNISSPANVSIAQGTSADLVYTITGTANGPNTYTLSVSDTLASIAGATPSFPGGTSLTLGATTLAAAAPIGATTITVPYDGNASTTTINGLVAGNTIIIGGNPYVIAAGGINKTSSTTTNTVVVTLTTAIAGIAGTVASIVPQQVTVHLTDPSGTVTSGTSGTQTISVSGTANSITGTQTTPTVVTVNRPSVTVAKVVSSDNGSTYASAVNAPPGTTLIYKITATNGGTSNATGVAFSDLLPGFVTYVANSGKYATSTSTAYSSGTALTDGSGGYTFTSNTVAYNPGGATGTVAGSGVLVLFFKATVN